MAGVYDNLDYNHEDEDPQTAYDNMEYGSEEVPGYVEVSCVITCVAFLIEFTTVTSRNK